MKWKGVRIDEKHIDILETKFKRTIDTCKERVKQEVGFYPELWAASSIAKVCDSLGITDYDRTEKTKKPSFTKNYLTNHKNKILKKYSNSKKIRKIK